jgi:archaellum component FlaC
MLKYLTNVVENSRIKKLETEVEGLKGELDYLRKQNSVMIESLEHINKYEKLLVQKVEEIAMDVLTLTKEVKK